MSLKKALALSLICLSAFALVGCSNPKQDQSPASNTAVMEPDQNNKGLTDADLPAFYTQSQLKSLDLRGNNLSISAVQALIAAMPGCEVIWSIPLGTGRFDSTSTELTLPQGTKPEELKNLSLFPALVRVDATVLPASDALKSIASQLPNCDIFWNIDVLGQSYPSDTTVLDLKSVTIPDTDALKTALLAFPALTSVDLTGQALPPEALSALATALPQTQFLYSVDLFGVSVESAATTADISNIPMESVDAVSQKIALLPNLTELVMCNCNLSNEQMEQLRVAHPSVKFVWLIRVGAWEMRTDVKAFSKGNRKTFDGGAFLGKGKTNFTSEDLEPLKYCTDLIALDLGHGSRITDLSILKYLPKLRFLILAMNRITSIEELKNCPDLEYVEIFQNYIGDWSPLLSLKKLTHLNCSTNYGKDAEGKRTFPDYTILKQMTQLQRLWIIRSGLGTTELEDLRAALPSAEINGVGSHSTSNGWRDNELYREMQGLFNLPISE